MSASTATVTALASALVLGTSAVADQRSTKRVKTRKTLSPARNQNVRPLALALACGVCYGVSAFAVKLVTSEFGGGAGQVFTNWPIYVLAVTGPLGYLFNQNALQQGKSLAPVQSIITAADPIISIALSILWLNVVLHDSPAAIFGEVATLILMVAGIVLTAHNSPHVTRPAAQTKAPSPSSKPGLVQPS